MMHNIYRILLCCMPNVFFLQKIDKSGRGTPLTVCDVLLDRSDEFLFTVSSQSV